MNLGFPISGPPDRIRSLKNLDPEKRERVISRARELATATRTILDAIGPKLPPERLISERQSERAGEFALAFESILATLVKERIPLTENEYRLVLKTMEVFGPDLGPDYDFISDPRTVLNALTIVDDNDRTISPPPGFDTGAFWPRRHARYRWGRIGSHLAGVGVPHKASFPDSWPAEKVTEMILDVARNPDEVPEQTRDGAWITRGRRDDVQIEVRLRPEGTIYSGYPLSGVGVHTTTADGSTTPERAVATPPPSYPAPHFGPRTVNLATERSEIVALHEHCIHLVEHIAPRLPEADQRRVRTALLAGEWLYLLNDLVAALLDDDIPITPDEHGHLAAALDLVGLGDDTAPRLRDPDAALAALMPG